MNKIVILLCFLLARTTYAADFTINFQPAPNSVNNTTIADNSISSNKINNFALDVISSISPSLTSYLLKTDLLSCPSNKKMNSVSGVLSCESISIGDTEVSALSQSKITGLDSSLNAKVNSSSLGSLAFKSSLIEADIPSLSIAKITNLQTSLDAKADSSSLGSLASKSVVTNSEINDNSISTSKILNFASSIASAVASSLSNYLLISDLVDSPTNLIINGNFVINQRVYLSGAALGSNTYAHDRWKSVSAGSSYTFTQNSYNTVVNISSGSIRQVIEGQAVIGGTYSLSWQGTASCRIAEGTNPTGSFGVSPQSVTINPGAFISIDCASGSLGLVQVNKGSKAAPFQARPLAQELMMAQRYYEKTYQQTVKPGTSGFAGSQSGSSLNTGGGGNITGTRFSIIKRTIPSITIYHPNTGAVNSVYEVSSAIARAVLGANQIGEHGFPEVVATGNVLTDDDTYYYHWTADAEIY